MKNNTNITEHSTLLTEYEPVFSCEFDHGVSCSANEEKYDQMLKDTYNYKPELYDHELFDSEFRLIDY